MYCDDSPDLRDVQLEMLCSEAKQDTAAGSCLVFSSDLPAEETSQEVALPLVVERGFSPRNMFSQRTDTRGNHSSLLLEAMFRKVRMAKYMSNKCLCGKKT